MARIFGIEMRNAATGQLSKRDLERGQRGNALVLRCRKRFERDSLSIVRKRAGCQFHRLLPSGIVEVRARPSDRNRTAVEYFGRRHRQSGSADHVLSIRRGAPLPCGVGSDADRRRFERERSETDLKAGRRRPPPWSRHSVKARERRDHVSSHSKIRREVQLCPRQPLRHRASRSASDFDAVYIQHEARVGSHPRGN